MYFDFLISIAQLIANYADLLNVITMFIESFTTRQHCTSYVPCCAGWMGGS